MTAPMTSREELLLVRLREAADHRGYPESFGGSWTQLALDALREIERLRAGVAQTRGSDPVAWRIYCTTNGATGYLYTEQLPFHPGEGVKVRREPEPLYSASSTHQNSTPWDAHHNRTYEPVETLAKEIYGFFEYAGVGFKPPWIPSGNSLVQDEARVCARKQLRDAGHAPVTSKDQP